MQTLCLTTATACLVIAGVLAPVQAAEVRRIYVATDGNDSADGLIERSVERSGPVRTLARARDVVREIRARGGEANAFEIVIAQGTYRVAQPLVLEGRDSGTPSDPLVYRAAEGAQVRISGGVEISGWQAAGGGVWTAKFDPEMFRGVCPTQLFVDDQRRERPRLPAEGTFAIGTPPPVEANGRTINDHFIARAGDLPADFKFGPGTEIVMFDAWTASRMRLMGYDPASRRVTLTGKFAGQGNYPNMKDALPYYIDNPIMDLTPGKWRCDPAERTLNYMPVEGEDLQKALVVAPSAGHLLFLRGTGSDPVHDLKFTGLTFEHTAWNLPPEGWAAIQAEAGLPAAIEMTSCKGIVLNDLRLTRLGAAGIGIRRHCIDVKVTDSVLDDLGGTAIAVGTELRRPTPGTDWTAGATAKGETHHVLVDNNKITRLGRIHRGAVGVWSGQAHHVTISRNFIHDLFYTGISVGWSFNPTPSLSHDNIIENNVISKYGQGVLSDFGGVYMLGRQDNTRVTGNIMFDGQARKYGGNGLYADEGSSNMVFSDNVIWNTSHAPIHLHYGQNLLFTRNVASDFGETAIRCTRKTDSDAVVFANNVFFNSRQVPSTFGECKASAFSFVDDIFVGPNGYETLNKQASESNWTIRPTGQ